ncbi:hypothetical protein EON79_01065 [bacterium]|nr:MAG: hypothetical protein EON79_01065 [bacterium]
MLVAALALVLANTPEDALKDFVAALNRGDVTAAVKLIDGADPLADRKEITKIFNGPDRFKIELGPIRRTGDKLTVDVEAKQPKGESLKVKGDTIDVVQREGNWLLVPGKSPTDQKTLLGSLTAVLKNDFIAKQAKSAAMKTAALSNLKQIALATLMLAGDSKDVLRLTSKNAESRIAPYMRSLEIFKDPGTGRSDVYTFNSLLANTSVASVESPAETVLWSIGPKGAILYPYSDGKQTLIAFVDGHVKSMTKEQVEKLRWKP